MPSRRPAVAAAACRPPIQGGNGWSDSRQRHSRWRLRCIGITARGAEIVLLDFWSPTCGPCMQMKPTVHSLEQAGYPIRQVDTYARLSSSPSSISVTDIPCFVMLVDGQEVDRAGRRHEQRTPAADVRAREGSGRIAAAEFAANRQTTSAPAPETNAAIAAGAQRQPRLGWATSPQPAPQCLPKPPNDAAWPQPARQQAAQLVASA